MFFALYWRVFRHVPFVCLVLPGLQTRAFYLRPGRELRNLGGRPRKGWEDSKRNRERRRHSLRVPDGFTVCGTTKHKFGGQIPRTKIAEEGPTKTKSPGGNRDALLSTTNPTGLVTALSRPKSVCHLNSPLLTRHSSLATSSCHSPLPHDRGFICGILP